MKELNIWFLVEFVELFAHFLWLHLESRFNENMMERSV